MADGSTLGFDIQGDSGRFRVRIRDPGRHGRRSCWNSTMHCTIRGSGRHANNNSTFEDGATGFTEIRDPEDREDGVRARRGSRKTRAGDRRNLGDEDGDDEIGDPVGDRDQINGTTIQRSRTVQDSDIGNRGDRNRGRRFGVRNNLGGRQIKTDNSDQADRNRGQRSSGRHRRQRFDVQGFGGSQEFLGILGSGSGSRTRDQHSRRSKTVRGISRVLGDLGIRGSGDLKSSWRS
jgi:hypothetical protein